MVTTRTHRRPGAGRVTALLVLLGVLLATIDALAVGPRALAAAPATGWARIGHFAPSEGAVDITVDGAPFAQGIGFKQATDYASLPAGVHVFELRPAGEPAADPIATVTADVPADGAITVGAVTTRTGLAAQLYSDALVTPEPGRSLVRFIHATPESAAVDVRVIDGPTLATGVPYPEATDYGDVAPGSYDVEVVDASTGEPVLLVEGWRIEPGTQASIVIVQGADGRIDVAPLRDAVAAAEPPVGGAQTDMGRSSARAGGTTTLITVWTALAGLAVVGGSILVGGRSRRRPCPVRVQRPPAQRP